MLAYSEIHTIDFSVIVFAFDEIQTLETVISEMQDVFFKLKRSYELVIVDDGSKDGTGELADRLASQIPEVRVIHHPTNCGLGYVYRTGFNQARGQNITFFPADGQFPASIILQFAPLMDKYDFVLGYLNIRRSVLAQTLSWLERCIYQALYGSFPRFQGVMMFKRAILERFALKSVGRGWAVVMELILRAQRDGCRMISVPTEIRPRLFGVSKVNNLRNILANLRQAIAIRQLL